jgi:hypothetical protein
VRSGERALVSVREQPARQIWIGFNSPTFARSADFVIFWTDVFDWLGGTSATEFRTERIWPLDSSWTRDVALSGEAVTADPAPGVYRSPAGELRAMSAIDLAFIDSPSLDWMQRLVSVLRSRRADATSELAPTMLIAALVLIAAAAVLWNRRRGVKLPTIPSDRHDTVSAKAVA